MRCWLPLLALFFSGCESPSGETATDTSDAKTARTSAPARASASAQADAPTAAPAPTVSAPAPNPIVAAFAGEVDDPNGAPKGIMRGGIPIGVIVLVPAPFGAGSGVYGDGYQTRSKDGEREASGVNFAISQSPAVTELKKPSEQELKGLCYPLKVDKIAWEPPVDVRIGAEATPAVVFKGAGVHIGTKKPWGAYAIATLLDKGRSVIGCGTWDSELPAAEKGVVQVLKSIRIGKPGPTDPGFP